MRRRGKVDANQAAIVDAFRKHGASVLSLASVGNGCPDLLVGFSGKTHLIEVKDGTKPTSERRLTPDQRKWFDTWRGGLVVVVDNTDTVHGLCDKWRW